jgi:Putative papain-like cysteine peptidase (DUF1796)
MSHPPKYVFSLGYRCSAAGILKRLQFKTESYPFDWLVSRLPIIEHCIDTNFREFLEESNYDYLQTNTYHYPTPLSPPQWICDERIYWNRFYEEVFDMSNTQLYIPAPLQTPRDAYAHRFLINHKSPTDDHDYYERCVERWRKMAESDYPKVALYIHPTQIEKNISEIKIEIERFHESISQTVKNYRGLYVIPVRMEHVYPIDQHVKEVVETIFETDTCTIVILWANRDFIDAGEIFMGNMWLETDRLCEWVQHQIRG